MAPRLTYTVGTTNNGQHQFAVEAVDPPERRGSASYTWKVGKGHARDPDGQHLAVGLVDHWSASPPRYRDPDRGDPDRGRNGRLQLLHEQHLHQRRGEREHGDRDERERPESSAATFTSRSTITGRRSTAATEQHRRSSPCTATSNEQLTVVKATPGLSTAPTPVTVAVGSSTATERRRCTGGVRELGGTATDKLYAPATRRCTGTPLTAASSTVTGGGTYSRGRSRRRRPGTWHWIATYSGDPNNAGWPAPAPRAADGH